ncbi:hypothetical protein BJ508DRAFT_321059 [Ascobolus immersus RN42]|uniref:Uncharacterized protein n=1 Tax=Ascobolus immersus RN42 TaxID=1160509 RepID=A0A3N4INZ8_ASCIM|nr:hypothetical protein BJ508DRAFT_321059 [Ascobolus immersus RN42]
MASTGKASIYNLPAELRLQILASVDSYDTLCLAISTFPEFVFLELFSKFPKGVLLSLLHKEMEGQEENKRAGNSIVVHALQLACMPIYGIDSTPREIASEVSIFLQEVRAVRQHKTAKEEAEFWLQRLENVQERVENLGPSSLFRLTEGTLSFLLKKHQIANQLLLHFSVDTLAEVPDQRSSVCLFSFYPTNPGSAEEESSARPYSRSFSSVETDNVSHSERTRILLAIYGLYFAVDITRLTPRGLDYDSWDALDSELTYIVWDAYDNIWQLEAISAVYSYLVSRLAGPLLQLRDKWLAEAKEDDDFLQEYPFLSSILHPKGSPLFRYEGHFEYSFLSSELLQYGVEGLLQRYAETHPGEGEPARKRPRPSETANMKPTSWPSPNAVKLLLETPRSYFARLEDIRLLKLLAPVFCCEIYGDVENSFRGETDMLRRAEKICGDRTEDLEAYCPMKRIAYANWWGFTDVLVARREQGLDNFEEIAWWRPSPFSETTSETEVRYDLAIWDEWRLQSWGFKQPIVGKPN